ncbi:MAG: hypothetical protein H3Z54_10900 [archaeon]|nr:hypothetical protein [archaeon]
MSDPQDLEPLARYLYDPSRYGAKYLRISLETKAIRDFVNNLVEKVKITTEERAKRLRGIPTRLQKAQESIEFFEELRQRSPRLGLITTAIQQAMDVAYSEEIMTYIKPVLDWVAFIGDIELSEGRLPSSFVYRRILRRPNISPFGPNIPLPKINDALHIAETEHRAIVVLEATSVKEEGIEQFLTFIKSLPELGPSYHVISKKTQFSSRFIYDLVPAAVSAWISIRSTIECVPEYILDYFIAALRYLEEQEWRTSIVLSAIALESLLAEMFEEEFQKIAPDIPLGALKDEIVANFKSNKKSSPFPDEISECVNGTNQARIAAVHRGGRQLSVKDATEALQGAVKFAIWHFFVRR